MTQTAGDTTARAERAGPGGHGTDVPDTAVQTGGAADVLAALGSGPAGLAGAEAARRLAADGRNELPRAYRRSMAGRFLAQFTDLFAVLLLVAAAITAMAYFIGEPRDPGNLQLTIAILGVVLINAAIGFGQEYAAERTAEALQAMVPHRARVVRDGVQTAVAAAELVTGDLVVLEAGDAVSADCRVVEAHELAVDNMALTGESEPARRTADAVPDAVGRLDARNRVWMGTAVAAGTGKAVVTATGPATEFGRIFRLAASTTPGRSPLQRQVALMARKVAVVALGLGVLLFAIRIPSGDPLVETFLFGLGVMVALVPEGLPATLSVALAVGVRRMARGHALIKKLVAVETLGSTTVICTDKTGTLTQAEMTVQAVWVPDRVHRLTGVGYAPAGTVEDPGPAVRDLLRVAALCNDARLVPPDGGARSGWQVLGDTTEGALLVAAVKAGLDLDAERAAAPRVGEFPFDSRRKLMTTLHRRTGEPQVTACVKGSPQEVLARCARLRDEHGRTVPLDDATRAAVAAADDAMARSALRVLAVAVRHVGSADASQTEAESGLTLLGLAGMLDPPRPEVTAAVGACHRAGIRVVMVTGDHALTAEAVARRVGILTAGPPRTVTGAELDRMDDDALRALLADPADVLFARVAPEHKLRIVSAYKDLGAVVAATGDGANDAPALKRADIGVAMGATGTDVAREASVMVLLDDSFASIATAVELGRSVYQNIRRFLVYVFSANVGELVPILAATFSGFPLVPITALQVLAIDLGSDVMPALALGAERAEPGIMDQPPRDPARKLFSAVLVRRILLLGGLLAVAVTAAFFWRVTGAGIPFSAFTQDDHVYREARTMVQAGIVVSQVFVGLSVRSDLASVVTIGPLSNRRLIAAQCLGVALVCAISYVPVLQSVFRTVPLSPADWALITVLGALPLAGDEIRKAVLRRRAAASSQGGVS